MLSRFSRRLTLPRGPLGATTIEFKARQLGTFAGRCVVASPAADAGNREGLAGRGW